MSGVNTLGDINEVSKVNNDEDTNEENSKVHESIINCVPQKIQFEAKMLLQRLHDFGDVTWDNRGKITIDGSAVIGGDMRRFTSTLQAWHKIVLFSAHVQINLEKLITSS